ncbi:hypothetical protein ACFQYP_05155 [Nonomuraea antimicrobica]
MLSIVIFLPLAAAALLALPGLGARTVVRIWIAATAADLALVAALWAGYGGGTAYETRLRWIPSARAGYHVGVDGLSLPLIAMTALLFLLCAVCSLRQTHRVRGTRRCSCSCRRSAWACSAPSTCCSSSSSSTWRSWACTS